MRAITDDTTCTGGGTVATLIAALPAANPRPRDFSRAANKSRGNSTSAEARTILARLPWSPPNRRRHLEVHVVTLGSARERSSFLCSRSGMFSSSFSFQFIDGVL